MYYKIGQRPKKLCTMPSYVLKRTYQAGYNPPSKRVRTQKAKLVRQLALRKPEVKDVVLSRALSLATAPSLNASGIFAAISQGTANSNRIGDKIRVLSITIAGRVAGDTNSTSCHLVCPNLANRLPNLSDFGSQVGTLYDRSHGWELYSFIRDPQSKSIEQGFTYTFPYGMVVSYSPPSETEPNLVTKNEVYAVHINRGGGATANIEYTVCIKFVDA